MIIMSPVNFDNGESFAPDGQPYQWSMKSGYDASGRRVTNLVGHDGQHFKKYCPGCEEVKIETAFGYIGRDTGEATRRDQSNCNECRGKY